MDQIQTWKEEAKKRREKKKDLIRRISHFLSEGGRINKAKTLLGEALPYLNKGGNHIKDPS